MDKKENKGHGFSSRIGLLLTLLGAAIGAGDFWRFPRVVTLNGGGAFLIAYLVIFFCFAIPIMCAEHGIGRATRHGLPGAFKAVSYTHLDVYKRQRYPHELGCFCLVAACQQQGFLEQRGVGTADLKLFFAEHFSRGHFCGQTAVMGIVELELSLIHI